MLELSKTKKKKIKGEKQMKKKKPGMLGQRQPK
jgi:hypothetical protein